MKASYLKTIGLLTILTVIGKLIAFAREMIIAYCFGASFSTDAYFLANGLVGDVLYAFTTAISVAFLPLYIESKKDKNSHIFVKESMILMGAISICISMILYLGAEKIAKVIAPTYDKRELYYVVLYIRILALGTLFPLFTNMMSSILNAERIYGYTALSGILYSIIAIVFSLLLYKELDVLALVVSIPIAYFLQCVVLIFRTKKIGVFLPQTNIKKTRVKQLLQNACPILISNTVIEINQMIDRILAVNFGDGAVSALSYSKTLSNFVNSLFVSTIIAVFFTELSYRGDGTNLKEFLCILKKGFLTVLILAIPIMIVTLFSSYDIVNIVYGRGAFNEEAIILTSQALFCYSIAFVFTVLNAYFVKAFYALGDTKIPMKNGIICILFNIILSVVLSSYIGFEGIALGTSISTFGAAIFLLLRLKKKIGRLEIFSDNTELLKIIVCTSIIVVGEVVINKVIFYKASNLRLGVNIFICFALYFLGLIILKCREVEEVWIEIKKLTLNMIRKHRNI